LISEENKALACRSWELVGQHDPDVLEEVYAADLVWHEPDQDVRGLEEAKRFHSTYLSAFPDLNATVEDVMAEGDKAVTRWTLRGTHQGETEEFGPPTGKQVELEGITIHRIEDSKIAEEWERLPATDWVPESAPDDRLDLTHDNLGALQQLGLVLEEQ
jgi:steroid delta-isomerase-like uncharacterized protein